MIPLANEVFYFFSFVLGSYFEAWYDDEAMMLANAVEYTAGAGGFGIAPASGVLAAGESAGLNLMYSTYDMVGEYAGNLLLLTDLEYFLDFLLLRWLLAN